MSMNVLKLMKNVLGMVLAKTNLMAKVILAIVKRVSQKMRPTALMLLAKV
jgi:hypothetical protein